MRFLQIVIITVILLAIVLAFAFFQKKDPQITTIDQNKDEQKIDSSTKRTATIFISVIGISVIVLCLTIVVFHLVG